MECHRGGEEWNQFVLPHSNVILCAAEALLLPEGSAVFVSTDAGINWKVTYTPSYVINTSLMDINDVKGDGCAIYVQRAHGDPDSSLGFIRSTDNGQTWVNVGGPIHMQMPEQSLSSGMARLFMQLRTNPVTAETHFWYGVTPTTSGKHRWRRWRA